MIRSTFARPLDPSEWSASLDFLQGGVASRLNVYRVMANHPDLLSAWAKLREHVVTSNKLGPELTEIAILRVSVHLQCEYERAHHIVRARACNISDARICAILIEKIPAEPGDGCVARCIDELFNLGRMTPDTTAGIVGLCGLEGALDLIALAGFYSTLGFMLNTFATPIDRDVEVELLNRPLNPTSGLGAPLHCKGLCTY